MNVFEIKRVALIACVVVATTASSQVQQAKHAAIADRVTAATNRVTSDAAPGVTSAVTSTAVTTTGGQTSALSAFTGATTIGSAQLYTNLTSGGLGIGRGPAAALDVLGQTIFRGGAVFSRSGEATTTTGKPSFQFQFQSSVWNSHNAGTLIPNFTLQSEPTGNNTASTGATLNFLYYSGVGCCPVETGLYINPNGTIHFSPSQTFPITKGPPGPAGPAGPAGLQGPQGPVGPSGNLTLPYDGSGGDNSGAAFRINNSGPERGDGIVSYGSTGSSGTTGGDGLAAVGGDSGVDADAGRGLIGFGGSSQGDNGFAGAGGLFMGGDGAGMGSQGGDGIDVSGGDSDSGAGFNGNGIVARADSPAMAGIFVGDVHVNGNISKSGGSFKIDHPIDPANKYLSHSFVESPDMMNIYNGNIVTDSSGTAIVTMPDWFEALNSDFRYQLTTIGQAAQAYIASEMSNRTFVIKTDKPNVKVSWQVTGVRQDAWANAHRIPVEEDKPERDKGKYLHPELFGRPNEANIEESHRPSLPKQKRVAPGEAR